MSDDQVWCELVSVSSGTGLPGLSRTKVVEQLCVCSLTICFALRKISFWHSGSLKSFAHSFCFFSFAEEISLFAFCLLLLYSFLAFFVFSFFHFLYFIFFSLTAPATSSFHYHVSLCLRGPFVIPHMSWAVSIIKPFILHSPAFTPRPFHVAFSTLSLTMHAYSSHVFSSLSFHTCTHGSNFLCQLFLALNHMSITNSLCFGWTGHVIQMGNDRLPKIIFYGELKDGARSRGGQRKRYKDMLKANLKRCSIVPADLETLVMEWSKGRSLCKTSIQQFESDRIRALEARREQQKTATIRSAACYPSAPLKHIPAPSQNPWKIYPKWPPNSA